MSTVLATRSDGATLVYDQDDKYGQALGHIQKGAKVYGQRPVIALLARGRWTLTRTDPVTAAVVRTPAGARKYGQPIGSVIVRDVVPRRVKGLLDLNPTPVPPEVMRVRGGHQPPDDSVTLDDLANQEIGTFPSDVYVNSQYYMHTAGMSERYEKESLKAIRRARGKPLLPVSIYRAVPDNVTSIEPGDWVSLSRAYAEQHSEDEGWHILTMVVPANSLRNGGNDLVEWGWFPKTPPEPKPPPEPEGPKKVRARYLQPGDVFQDEYPDQTSRVLTVSPEEEGFVHVTAIRITGKNVGGVIHREFSGDFQANYIRHDAEQQDFEHDVIEPLKVKVAALKEKYPEGLAAALDRAVSGPGEPKPEKSARLQELENDPEVKMWEKAQVSAQNRLSYLEGQRLRGKATVEDVMAADKEVYKWRAEKRGGKALEYVKELKKYHRQRIDWEDRDRAAQNVLTPHTPQAQEILADVRDIGQTARIGIEIELTTSLPKPVATGAGASSMEAFASLQKERDWQQATWKMRRELAQRVVAETVGAATSTKQAWTSTTPKMNGQKHLRDLTPEEKDALTAGLLRYPASWVERFDRQQYTTSMAERGWHSEHVHHIALSDFDGKGISEDGSTTWATIVHEEGHGMEDAVPGLALLETIWWHDRMGEASPKKYYLADDARFPEPDRPGTPGQKNIARPTSKSYSMKMYGNVYRKSETKFWEAFTTGVQEVLGDGKTDYTVKWDLNGFDADLWEVTMGALLTIDPSTGGAANAGDSVASPAP